jgi:hypothetical protein
VRSPAYISRPGSERHFAATLRGASKHVRPFLDRDRRRIGVVVKIREVHLWARQQAVETLGVRVELIRPVSSWTAVVRIVGCPVSCIPVQSGDHDRRFDQEVLQLARGCRSGQPQVCPYRREAWPERCASDVCGTALGLCTAMRSTNTLRPLMVYTPQPASGGIPRPRGDPALQSAPPEASGMLVKLRMRLSLVKGLRAAP